MISNLLKGIALVILMAFFTEAYAQGKWQIGAQGNYYKTTYENYETNRPSTYSQRKLSNVGVNLFGTYSFNSHLSAGLVFGLENMNLEYFSGGFNKLNDTTSIITYNLGLLFRLRAPLNKKFGFNADIQLAYKWSDYGTYSDFLGKVNARYYKTSFNIIPRVYYNLNDNISLDFSFGRLSYIMKESIFRGSLVNTNSDMLFDFTKGFQLGVYYRFGSAQSIKEK